MIRHIVVEFWTYPDQRPEDRRWFAYFEGQRAKDFGEDGKPLPGVSAGAPSRYAGRSPEEAVGRMLLDTGHFSMESLLGPPKE